MEAQTKEINEEFPSDTLDYVDDYDYFSDSDLEDELSCFVEEDEGPVRDDEPVQRHSSQDSNSRVPTTTTPGNPQSLRDPIQVENHHTSASDSLRVSKFPR